MNFQHHIIKIEGIILEVAQELGQPNNKDLAYRILRVVLHTLRARLTLQESFQLMAQMPMLLKAIYADSWKYSEKPKKIKNKNDFVNEVALKDSASGHHDILTIEDGEHATRAVLRVLRRHISEGEIQDILQTIPPDLRPLWGEPSLT